MRRPVDGTPNPGKFTFLCQRVWGDYVIVQIFIIRFFGSLASICQCPSILGNHINRYPFSILF